MLIGFFANGKDDLIGRRFEGVDRVLGEGKMQKMNGGRFAVLPGSFDVELRYGLYDT